MNKRKEREQSSSVEILKIAKQEGVYRSNHLGRESELTTRPPRLRGLQRKGKLVFDRIALEGTSHFKKAPA